MLEEIGFADVRVGERCDTFGQAAGEGGGGAGSLQAASARSRMAAIVLGTAVPP
jgi:hypothetical protein